MIHVLDIASPALMEIGDFEYLCNEFSQMTGNLPAEVVVPLVSAAGPNWPSQLCRGSYLEDPAASPGGLASTVREVTNKGLGYWLGLNLGLPFAQTASNNIKDQAGGSAAQVCINAPGSTTVVKMLVEEALQTLRGQGLPNPMGFVLPIQDLWPMGSSDKQIEATCFCGYCRKALGDHGFDKVDEFTVFPNPLNLALEASTTGIRHMHELAAETNPERIVHLSRAQSFIAKDMTKDIEAWEPVTSSTNWGMLSQWADALVGYVSAREASTFESLERIVGHLREAGSKETRIAVISEPFEYSWTAGYFFDHLLEQRLWDELWCAPLDRSVSSDRKMGVYGCSRARYLVDSMFFPIETAKASFRSATPAQYPQVRRRRISRVLNQVRGAMVSSPLHYSTIVLFPEPHRVIAPPLSVGVLDRLQAKFAPVGQGQDETLDLLDKLVAGLPESVRDEE